MYRTHPVGRRDAHQPEAAAATALAESFAYLSASEPRPPRTPPTTRLHSRYEDLNNTTATTPPPLLSRGRSDQENDPRRGNTTPRARRRGAQVAFSHDEYEDKFPIHRAISDGEERKEDSDDDDDRDSLVGKTLGEAATLQLEEDAAQELHASHLEQRFVDACRRGSTRSVERLLARRPDLVYATGTRLNTGLHTAAEYKRANVAQLLLASGANVDQVNQDGQTPLHLAAAVGSREVIRVLGNHHATIDARSKRNYTPLHMATSRGHASAAMRLIDLGADVDAAAKGGIRPLHIAAFARDDVLVTHLLDRGASIDAMDDKRLDALNYAMMSQSSTVFHVIYSRILDKFKSLQEENQKLQRKAHEAKAQVHLIQDSKWLSKIPPLYTVVRLPARRKSVAGILQLPTSRKDKLLLMVHSQLSGVCFHEPLDLEIARERWRELHDVTIGGLYFLTSVPPDVAAIVARGLVVSVEQAVRRRLGREEYIRAIMDNVRGQIELCISGGSASATASATGVALPGDAAASSSGATHPYQLKKLLSVHDKDFHWTQIPSLVRVRCAYHKKWRRLVWASDDEIQSHALEPFFHPPSGVASHHYHTAGGGILRPSSTGSGSKQSSSFGGDDSEEMGDDHQHHHPQGAHSQSTSANPLMSVTLRLLHVHCRLASDYNNAHCEWWLENRVSGLVHDTGRFRVRSLLPQQGGGSAPGGTNGGVIHLDPLMWTELRDAKLVFRVLRTNSSGVSELVKELVIEAKYELEFDRSSNYRCSLTKRLTSDALLATLVLEGKRLHYAGRRRAPSN